MKKILVLLLATYLSTSLAQAKFPEESMNRPAPPKMSEQERIKHEQAFEQRLGLTDEQKQKGKELRMESREKIKPIIDKIRIREDEMRVVKQSSLSEEEKEVKLKTLKADLKELHKQAHDIRVENMKKFEETLTADQKKILKEMKQEGRDKFKQHHMPPKPPEER